MRIKLKNPNDFKKLLIIKGFSQTKMAKEINITTPYLNQIVNEDRFPSAKIAKKISAALESEFEDIFFIDDAYNSKQVQ